MSVPLPARPRHHLAGDEQDHLGRLVRRGRARLRRALADQVDTVVVCGLSMGGAPGAPARRRPPRPRRRARAGQPGGRHRAQGRQAAAGAQARGPGDARASPTTSRSPASRSTATPGRRCKAAALDVPGLQGAARRPRRGHRPILLLPLRPRTTSSTRRSARVIQPRCRSTDVRERDARRTATTSPPSTTTPSRSSRARSPSSSASPASRPEADRVVTTPTTPTTTRPRRARRPVRRRLGRRRRLALDRRELRRPARPRRGRPSRRPTVPPTPARRAVPDEPPEPRRDRRGRRTTSCPPPPPPLPARRRRGCSPGSGCSASRPSCWCALVRARPAVVAGSDTHGLVRRRLRLPGGLDAARRPATTTTTGRCSSPPARASGGQHVSAQRDRRDQRPPDRHAASCRRVLDDIREYGGDYVVDQFDVGHGVRRPVVRPDQRDRRGRGDPAAAC